VLWLEQACSVASGRSFAVRYRGETAKKISDSLTDRPLCSTPCGNSFAMNYSGPGQFGSRQIRSQASRVDSRYGVQLYALSCAWTFMSEGLNELSAVILRVPRSLRSGTLCRIEQLPSVTNRSSIIRLCGNSLPYPKSS